MIYLHEDARVPCSRNEHSPVTHHEALTEGTLGSGVSVWLEDELYTIVRRLCASQEFMREVHPEHFLLELHDEALDSASEASR
jgi:hypothetical protein